jgi:hypothetical protein
MDVGGPAWDEAVRAWRRVVRRATGRGSSDADAGSEALDALSDVSVIRRLLDHVEMASVRRARRHGKSWAEIATNLGVTRQSAWERWRDLDEAGSDADSAAAELDQAASLRETARQVVSETARGLVRAGRKEAAVAVTVPVPDVISLNAGDAWQVLHNLELVAKQHNPGDAPLALSADSGGVVVDQVPKAGARRRPGSPITLWVSTDGGSAGMREPRRPVPPVRSAQAELPEQADLLEG